MLYLKNREEAVEVGQLPGRFLSLFVFYYYYRPMLDCDQPPIR